MEQSLLTSYGECIATYKGEGTLTLQDRKVLQCTFEAGQLKNGTVLLLCYFQDPAFFSLFLPAYKFEGITSDGFHILAVENFLEINYLPDRPTTHLGMWSAYLLREITIQIGTGTSHQVRFGITNFSCVRDFSLDIEDANNPVVLSVKQVKEYDKIHRRMQVLKTADVTCEVTGDVSPERTIEQLAIIVDNLCYILSVARGTKVQWVYQENYDANGRLLSRIHAARITKAYSSLSVIDPQSDSTTKQFIEKTYGTYLANRDIYQLLRLIDSFLDSIAEHDYLQLRGLKLAVTMETFKDIFLGSPSSPVKGFITEPRLFKKLIPRLRELILPVLKQEGVNVSGKIISEKLQELNRRAFAEVLEDILGTINLTLKEKDKELFIKCRNSLVHRGRFYSEVAKQEELEKYEALSSHAGEYYFLVSILHKVILKLLSYSGNYLDWCVPGQPSRKQI